jgi:iron complex outermembrane receptor protein
MNIKKSAGASGLFVASFALAAAAGLAGAPGALAQQATEEAGERDEIIVTAQKREQRLQDVPAAVTVVGGELLDGGPAYNVEGITQLIPTLNFNKGGTNLNSSLFMRGVGTINFAVSAEPSVAFVLDGVVMSRAGEAFGDLYDVQRIEVLRGPQGTLFGKNASAGVVNVISRMPGGSYGGQLDLSYFEGNEQRVKASVDLPLSDTFLTRFTAFAGTYDGNITNLAKGEKTNGYDRWGVRGIATWEAAPNLNFTFIGDYRHAADECCAPVVGTAPTGATGAALTSLLSGVTFLRDETRTIRQDTTTQTKEESWGASAQADWELANGFTITSITAYRGWNNLEIREGDFLASRTPAYANAAFNRVEDFGPQESKTISQELRLTSPDEGPFTYVIGGYYSSAESDRTFRRDVIQCTATTLAPDATGLFPCAATPGASTFINTFSRAAFGSELTNLAVFADGQFDLSEQLTLLGGLRWTRDEVTAYHVRTNLAAINPVTGTSPGGVSATPNNVNLSTEETNVSGRIGAQFKVSDQATAYATYTRGYKGPAFNVFFQMNNAGNNLPNNNQSNVIEAETADSYEVGLKTNWFDNRLIVNAAVFNAAYDNFQANSPDLQGTVVVTRLTNAGEISTKGFELDALLRASDTFSMNFGLAYTDAQIEKFRNAGGVLSDARAGEQLPFAPEFKGVIGLNKEWRGPLNVYLSGAWNFVSSQQPADIPTGGFNPAFRTDSSDQIDASLGFSDPNDRFRVTLIGKNLTDDSYPSQLAGGGPGGIVFRIPREADRYYGISARLRWGD